MFESGFEVFKFPEEIIQESNENSFFDLVFTSPPYFDYEIYN